MLGLTRQFGTGQNVTIGAASAVTPTPAPTGVFGVRLSLVSTGSCHVSLGIAPVALATDLLLKGSDPARDFAIQPGEKVAAIQDGASTGTLNVVWLTQ